ncbi:MAG: maleylpyruvate isomerase family mycothiol-dependent enzyme [Acidimicrobiia bacterium]|nr:maleylpyruvate isomerase family mycothiol-dependent enzyme [Acidimicrobiia bacterium]
MDLFALLASERQHLADELDQLTPTQWSQPSLCEGWSNHVVAAHLNLPWSVRPPAFVIGLLRARGSIDRAMDRFSQEMADRLDPQGCVDLLRANATSRLTPPGMGVEAPLTDVVVHGADVLRPLGRSRTIAPDALRSALTFVTSWKAAKGFGARSIDGLTVEATDVDLRLGSGAAVVSGPALALCGALLGRADFLSELSGDGVARLGFES